MMHFIYMETHCSQWIKKNSHQDLIITRKDLLIIGSFLVITRSCFFLFSESNALPQMYAIPFVCLFLTNPECYDWKLLLMLADDVSQWFCLLTCWTLTDWSGKLSLEAIQVVCEELRKKGVCTMRCWSSVVVASACSQLTVTGHLLSLCPSLMLSLPLQGTWSGRTKTRAAAWWCGGGRRSGPSLSTSGWVWGAPPPPPFFLPLHSQQLREDLQCGGQRSLTSRYELLVQISSFIPGCNEPLSQLSPRLSVIF